jgi:hypothetical protein
LRLEKWRIGNELRTWMAQESESQVCLAFGGVLSLQKTNAYQSGSDFCISRTD